MRDSAPNHRNSPRPGHLRAVPGGLSAAAMEPHPLLRQAGEDVLNIWEGLLGDAFEPNEARGVVTWLVTAIDAGARDWDLPNPEGPTSLTRFLLERVSSALLLRLVRDPQMERDDILRLMRGVDIVRQSVEPDWDRYFESQIAGPDGLNLVLEVAHDLRSPLTSIRCLAETMERGQSGPLTDLQRKQLRLIYSASLGLGSMATDVIEMARRGDQLLDTERVPFSVSELLEGVVDMVRPIAEEKGLAVKTQHLASDQRVGMPFALGRVLLNLVTNALKFTDEGRVEVQVRSRGLNRVEFAVADTGRGIPDEAIADLYRPFRRSKARLGRSGYLFSGTGLGLALCRKLLRALNSELHFETKAGEGTRFFFELELPPAARL
jgi:signal transduction histidine kinase